MVSALSKPGRHFILLQLGDFLSILLNFKFFYPNLSIKIETEIIVWILLLHDLQCQKILERFDLMLN